MMVKKTGDNDKAGRIRRRRKKVEDVPGAKEVKGIRIEEAPNSSIAMDAAASFVPGLMELIEGLKKTGPFQQRLKDIDEELRKRLKDADAEGKKPHIDYSFSVRTLHDGVHMGIPPSAHGKSGTRRPPRPQVKMDKNDLKEKDRLVEILETKEELLILVELRGLDVYNIHQELLNDQLLVVKAKRDEVEIFRKEIPLPVPVAKEISSDSRNGILIIRLVRIG